MPQAFGWGGLNTKADATGLPLLECVHLQDMRVVGKDLVQRLGIARIGSITGTVKAADFVAASSMYFTSTATADARVWTLGRHWTLELAFQADGVSGTQVLLGFGHASNFPLRIYLSGTDLVVEHTDSASAVVTLTHSDGGLSALAADTTYTVQVRRDGTTLYLYLDNALGDSGAVADLTSIAAGGALFIGRDNTGNYYDGTIDYLRLMTTVRSNHNDRLIRLPNPRAKSVMCDYDFDQSSGGLIYDRSRYENHLIPTNTPTEVTSLCHNTAPVRAISMCVDEANRKQLLVAAGGQYFIVSAD